MAHHNPKACESYCCWNCGGVMTSNPCGIYWYTTGAVTGRIINASDEVFATGQQGSVEVASGTYRLQVQCAVGGEWITAEEVEHVADETLCNCCDIMEPYQSHTLSNLDHLSSSCFELPATLTFPTKFCYDWTGNVIATPCSSCYRIYEGPRIPLISAAEIQAAACWTGSYLGDTYWVALYEAWMAIDVLYSTFGSVGNTASIDVAIAYFLTDGSSVGFGTGRRRWRGSINCPPDRDWVVRHDPSADSVYPPWVGVTTENLIINTQ